MSRSFRDRLPEFSAADATVHGVCTQRPERSTRFAENEAHGPTGYTHAV